MRDISESHLLHGALLPRRGISGIRRATYLQLSRHARERLFSPFFRQCSATPIRRQARLHFSFQPSDHRSVLIMPDIVFMPASIMLGDRMIISRASKPLDSALFLATGSRRFGDISLRGIAVSIISTMTGAGDSWGGR